MSGHAVLSPSSASRWLACTPSARLERQYPDSSGDAAREGTVAHALGELMIRQKLFDISLNAFDKQFKELLATPEGAQFFSQAMYEHCEEYAFFVVERIAEVRKTTPDALIFLERHLDLTDYVPEGFGTGDCVIIADGTLEIIDLKYGKGVLVSAEDNKQMKLYALGALKDFDMLYDIERVSLTIYQPRIGNFSHFELPVTELVEWAETELRPKAALAFEGKGERVAGTHCKFCKAGATCKALATYNLDAASIDFADVVAEGPLQFLTDDPNELSPEYIAALYQRIDEITGWLKKVEDYALDQAVNKNVQWPGLKLVEGRSNRVMSDEGTVLTVLREAGLADDRIYKPAKMNGITELQKALGSNKFKSLIEPLLVKPPGKPTLVPESDKRPALNTAEAAAADFADVA